MWMPAFMLNPVPSSFSTDQVPAFVNRKKGPSVPITVYKLTGSSIQQKREQLKMYKFKNNLFKLSSNSEKLQSCKSSGSEVKRSSTRLVQIWRLLT